MMKPIALASLLFLAACGSGGGEGNDGGDDETTAAAAPVEQVSENLQQDPTNTVVPLAPPSPAPTPAATPVASLPAAFHGRWGEGENDCVPGRADAKGLMTITADRLSFYEARARIESMRTTRPGTLELDLAFTGEGQSWNRRQTLTLVDGGRTLLREEQRPAAAYRYTRCPAGQETPVDQRGA